MKRACWKGLLLCGATVPFFCCLAARGAEFGGGARVETENFVVLAYDIKVARRVGRDVERRRGEISRALGISEPGAWRPRCTVHICDNRTAYTRDSGGPSWSAGWSRVETTAEGGVTRTVFTFEKDTYEELMSVLTHELAHVIFRDAVVPSSKIPLWLDEGVANFIQMDGMKDYKKIAKKEVKRGASMPLTSLFLEKNYPAERTLFYAESASIVDMMTDTFGKVPFLVFAGLLTNGVPPSRALNNAYSSFTGDTDDFDDEWKEYVIKNY